MISFRFHLVSLVAIFLALGVGVLTGTTVINRGVVSRLETQTEDLSGDLDALRGELGELQGEAEVWGEFGEEAMGPILSGRLTQQQVVIFTQDGTNEESLQGIRRALEAGGAEVVALLSAGSRMALSTEADREALAELVGMSPTDEPDMIAMEAARLVAERLEAGPNGTDTLEQLLGADFLVIQGSALTETGLRSLGGPDQVVLTVAGGPAPSELRPERFLVPLTTDLAVAGMPVAAAEPARGEEQEPPFVTVLRGEPDVSSLIATQDNVDQLAGQIGIVLAIEDLLLGDPGHYGVKGGASRALPELP
ncbi:MAG: copper transporter [Actinomycetota bacterium]